MGECGEQDAERYYRDSERYSTADQRILSAKVLEPSFSGLQRSRTVTRPHRLWDSGDVVKDEIESFESSILCLFARLEEFGGDQGWIQRRPPATASKRFSHQIAKDWLALLCRDLSLNTLGAGKSCSVGVHLVLADISYSLYPPYFAQLHPLVISLLS